jgi:hypothetical protein
LALHWRENRRLASISVGFSPFSSDFGGKPIGTSRPGADLACTGRVSLHESHFANFNLALHISIFCLHVEDAEAVGVALSQDGLRSMLVPAKTCELFERLCSSWMLSTFTPAARVDHPDLAKAFADVGVKPPNRKLITCKHLDAVHRSTLQEVTGYTDAGACVTL